LTAIFLILSFALVIATLRITITAKGVELEIQKLVGASDRYVKTPLILQGVFYGVVASFTAFLVFLIVSIVLTTTGLPTGSFFVPFLSNARISLVVYTLGLGFFLILSGGLLGYIGSYAAIKKYLDY
jgi:cell division transport system permease protein